MLNGPAAYVTFIVDENGLVGGSVARLARSVCTNGCASADCNRLSSDCLEGKYCDPGVKST